MSRHGRFAPSSDGRLRTTNLILVTHQVNIAALIGTSVAPGELILLRAGDAKGRPIGRLRPAARTTRKGDP
jgi:hypothetical protein